MIGSDADYYLTNDATVVIGATDITIASGAVALAQSWRTLRGQTLTVAAGASFTVPAGMTFTLYSNAIVNGTLVVNGAIDIAEAGVTLWPTFCNSIAF